MKAVILTDFDSGPTLQELPRPEPDADELLVRVHASSINGFDVAVAAGMLKGMMEHEFPVTLGGDLAGTVEQVGAQVRRFHPGDEVFGLIVGGTLHDGTWAEYVVLSEEGRVVPKPKDLGFLAAGALPLAGGTALAAVDAVSAAESDTVLIVGATGGVGSFAVQMAAKRGAKVIATAESDDRPRVESLGAADTIDYKELDVAAAVRERYRDGVDCVIDLVNQADGFAAIAALVRDDGRAASALGAADDAALSARGIRAVNIVGAPDVANLSRLGEMAATGELEVSIDEVYPLERATEAIARFASGKRGKIALAVADS